MAYLVATAGRVLLPEPLEHQALTVLEVELARHEGRFHPDRPVADLAELAGYAGAGVRREGDWLVVSTDREGEPQWSPQADAFYRGLGRFATDGEVQLRGQDGAQWSYRYTAGGVAESGSKAGGTPTAAPVVEATGPPPPPPAAPQVPPVPPPPAGPPAAESTGWPPDPAAAPDPYFAADAPAPRSPGRTAGMVALLVVGVLVVIGVALLASGIV